MCLKTLGKQPHLHDLAFSYDLIYHYDFKDEANQNWEQGIKANKESHLDYNQAVNSLFRDTEVVEENKEVKKRFGKVEDRGKLTFNYGFWYQIIENSYHFKVYEILVCKYYLTLSIDMFRRLKSLWKSRQIDITKFWESDGPLKGELQILLHEVFPDINFKRSDDFLIKRIRKVGRNTKFSVRERMHLKRLLKEQGHTHKIKLMYILKLNINKII